MKPIAIWTVAALLALAGLWYLHDQQPRAITFTKADIDIPGPGGPTPSDWFHAQRAYPFNDINYAAYDRARSQARLQHERAQLRKQDAVWQLVAPNLNGGGRLTDVEITPTDRIYAGAASGGLFRSEDMGQTWQPLTDHLPSLPVGDLAVAPSNPDILFLGTGEPNGSSASGTGVYKSTDGGDSWLPVGLTDSRYIGRIAVHPTNPDIVYTGAMGRFYSKNEERGLFRSKDGGLNWERVLFIDDSTGTIDVAIDPQRPDRVFAVMWERLRQPSNTIFGGLNCGIYRSLDGGDTWTELTEGLPENNGTNVGRIGIDIAASDPDTLYAVYANASGDFNGVYKSIDGGDSWTRTNDGYLTNNNAYSTFGWWFGNIRVSPHDPNLVYLLGLNLFVSRDGGQTWRDYHQTLTPQEIEDRENFVHIDHHGMRFSSHDPDLVTLGNDGGFYLSSTDPPRFELLGNPTNFQFYTCRIDPNDPDVFYGGLQDNGTDVARLGASPWSFVLGGDGFQVLVTPGDSNNIFAEAQFGFIVHFPDPNSFHRVADFLPQDDRFNWNTPMAFDPADPTTLYVGAQRMHRAENFAPGIYPFQPISHDLSDHHPIRNRTWGTITTFAVAPGGQTIYAGTDDGNVWVTRDSGDNWTDISENLPDRYVTRLAVQHDDPSIAYITFSGFRDADFQPHVLRTADGGQSWTDISSNLPEAPVNDIVIDPENPATLYVASDFGVYHSRNQGGEWEILGRGLPFAPVLDIDLHPGANRLAAATFGRSMYYLELDEVTDGPNDLSLDYVLTETPVEEDRNTHVVVVNLGESASQISISAISDNGTRIDLHESQIPGNGQARFDLKELFLTQPPAWVQVGGGDFSVVAEIQGPGTLGAYWASKPEGTNIYLPHVARDTTNFETFLSTANTTTGLLNHKIQADPSGQFYLFREHREPLTRVHGDIRQFLGANLDEVQFARLQSDKVGHAAMEYFLTLPERDRLAALGLSGQAGSTLRFLHVAENTSVFWTGLVAINVSDATTPLITRYFDTGGSLLLTEESELQSGQKITHLRDQNGSATIPEGTTWVEMTAAQPLTGYELFGSVNTASDRFFAGLQGNYSDGTEIRYPIFQADENRWTGLVAVNTGEVEGSLQLELIGADGQVLEVQTTDSVAPKAKITLLANDFFKDPEAKAKANGKWVRAKSSGSYWAGFQLWGDHNVAPRQNLAGIHATSERD